MRMIADHLRQLRKVVRCNHPKYPERPLRIASNISAKPSGLEKTKFYELVREGKIKTVVIGGRRLVPADEAQRLIREGCE
jgi:hypothetical protein